MISASELGHGDSHEDIRDVCRALGVESGGPVTQASLDALGKWTGIEQDVDARDALEGYLFDDTAEGRECQNSQEGSRARGGASMRATLAFPFLLHFKK